MVPDNQNSAAAPQPAPVEDAPSPGGAKDASGQSALPDAWQELEMFAYTVSHDLRAPLRSIKGFTIALREDYGHLYDQTGQDYARRVVEGAERMEQMIDALLAYSRVGRGETPITRIELEDFLVNLAKRMAPELQARKAQFEIVRPLPAIQANPSLLELAVTQFLLNALRFVAPEVVPQIRITAEQRGGLVRLKVEDNGIGIEERHFQKLFKIFQRLNSTDKYPGLGVGLAMTRKAAMRMGGRVGVTSQIGKGSEFWIELPAG